RTNVVRQQDAPFSRSLVENGWILRPGEFHVLNANDVQVRYAPQEAAHDSTMKVLIRGEAKDHGPNPLLASAREKSSDASGTVSGFTRSPCGGPASVAETLRDRIAFRSGVESRRLCDAVPLNKHRP